MVHMLDVQERFMSGKIIEEKEYDMRLLPAKLKELAEKYDVSYSPEDDIIPAKIDSQVKAIFDAAVELIEDLGFYNPDTRRTATFTKKELMAHIRRVPKITHHGIGQQKITSINRKPEDNHMPAVECGTYGTPITDEVYVQLNAGFAMEGDRLWSAALRQLDGRYDVIAGAPSECIAGLTEAHRMREALIRAGKPGMQLIGVGGASKETTVYSSFNEEGGFRKDVDCVLISFPAEMKMPWDYLNRSAWCQMRGILQNTCSQTILGGYAGGPATSAICHVAENIGITAVTNSAQMDIASVCDMNGFFANPKVAWANARTILAIKGFYAKNTWGGFGPCSGPCTEENLLEIANLIPLYHACGMDWICGNVSTIGVLEDHQTPFEIRFQREVHKAIQGISLKDANHLYTSTLPLFIDKLDVTHHEPAGKKFQECYDITTLTPSQEWLDIYDNVKKKLADYGYDWKS